MKADRRVLDCACDVAQDVHVLSEEEHRCDASHGGRVQDCERLWKLAAVDLDLGDGELEVTAVQEGLAVGFVVWDLRTEAGEESRASLSREVEIDSGVLLLLCRTPGESLV